jgi:hypothetical protein
MKTRKLGIQALGSLEPLPTGSALVDYCRKRLGKAERLILETLTQAYPARLNNEGSPRGTGSKPRKWFQQPRSAEDGTHSLSSLLALEATLVQAKRHGVTRRNWRGCLGIDIVQ